MPLTGGFWNEAVFVEGAPEKALSNFTRVSPNFFEVLGIPIVKGRPFSAADALAAPPVAIVNETFVRKLLPDGSDPIGDALDRDRRRANRARRSRSSAWRATRSTRTSRTTSSRSCTCRWRSRTTFRDFAHLLVKPRGAIDG